MRKLLFGSSLVVLLMAGTLGTALSADYTPVTDARLANPEPENWLMTRGNYKGWSYSPLTRSIPATSRTWCRCGLFRPVSIPATRPRRSSTTA